MENFYDLNRALCDGCDIIFDAIEEANKLLPEDRDIKMAIGMATSAHTLVRQNLPKELACQIIARVCELLGQFKAPMTFNERVEAILSLATPDDEGETEQPGMDIEGVLALDDQTLARRIDNVGMNALAQLCEDWGV